MHKLVSQRYFGVEALRFFAAAMVVVTHATFFAKERNDPAMAVWHFGEAGVHIFFVISGFVIVIASRRDGEWVTATAFAIKRFARIMPMYWLATAINLAVLILVPTLVLHSSLDWGQIIRSFFLVPDYNADGRIEPLVGVAWTLYFESLFYCVFAMSLFLRFNPMVCVPVVLFAFGGVSFVKTADWPPISVYFNPIVLEFVGGMALAALRHRISFSAAVSFVILGIGIILLVILGEMESSPLGKGDRGGLHDLLYRGAPSFIVVVGTVSIEPYVNWKKFHWFVFLGGASYCIYLFHPIIAPAVPVVLTKLGVVSGTLSTAGGTALSVAIASLIYAVLDKPLMRCLSRSSGKSGRASPAPV